MKSEPSLPEFISPMLAQSGAAFDSKDHVFEIKWDGIRCLARRDRDRLDLFSRRNRWLNDQYPELSELHALPPGIWLDGEIVVLNDGKPDFHAVLEREQSRSPKTIEAMSRRKPVNYVVFDILYEGFDSICSRPLIERRQRLEELIPNRQFEMVFHSEIIENSGTHMFEHACDRGLEGIVAKRKESAYHPGKRSDSWIKIKRRDSIYCAIIGYIPSTQDPFKSLLLATDDSGSLTYVGRVASGLNRRTQERLVELFAGRSRNEPLVENPEKGCWLEPGLYCIVSYTERTRRGMLRAPVFRELIME